MSFRGSTRNAPFFTALALLLACENDVAVRLLPKPQVVRPPDMTTTQAEGGGAGAPDGVAGMPDGTAGTTPVCRDGDACSGLVPTLYFKGPYDRVEIPASPLLDVPQDFSFEAWVLVKSYAGGHGVLNRWTAGQSDLQLTFGVPEPISVLELPTTEVVPSHVLATWAFVRPNEWLTVAAPALPVTGSWHHLATSYGAGSYRLYVDGVLQGSMDSTEPVANVPSTLYLGATGRNEHGYTPEQGQFFWPPIDGFIAEVRLSSSNRYQAEFTPEARLSVDADTLALWHMDEGSGSSIFDSGPSQLGGVIFGASWAFAPVRVVGGP